MLKSITLKLNSSFSSQQNLRKFKHPFTHLCELFVERKEPTMLVVDVFPTPVRLGNGTTCRHHLFMRKVLV